jgi:hypothetical protein
MLLAAAILSLVFNHFCLIQSPTSYKISAIINNQQAASHNLRGIINKNIQNTKQYTSQERG